MLDWSDPTTFTIGGHRFGVIEEDAGSVGAILGADRGDVYWIAKTREMLLRLARVLDDLQPRRIFELGVFRGGSTVFLAEYCDAERIVAIDQSRRVAPALVQYARSHGEANPIVAVPDVSQDDADRLRGLVRDEFAGPLDLVIDDASHAYAPTRVSFEALFGHLRPGGRYLIEDWNWELKVDEIVPEGSPETGDTLLTGSRIMTPPSRTDRPLIDLAYELVLTMASSPGLISSVTAEDATLSVTRGNLSVEPDAFRLADHYDQRLLPHVAP